MHERTDNVTGVRADGADAVRILTHELATPLAALQASLALLLADRTDSDALTAANVATAHLVQVVARTRSQIYGHPAGGPDGSIGALFDEIVSMLTPVASPNGVSLKVDCGDAADALVPTWVMRQVIVNLVANALKYAPGSDVTLSARRCGSGVEISVADRGPGVPAEFISSLTEPGFRMPHHQELPGDGLGLTVCRNLLATAGGSLAIRSDAMRTVVTASLPLAG